MDINVILQAVVILLVLGAVWIAYRKGYEQGETHQLNLTNAFEQGKVYERISAEMIAQGKPAPSVNFRAVDGDGDEGRDLDP